MLYLRGLRRECAQRRVAYIHAHLMYYDALRLRTVDTSVLRSDLGDALVEYHAAHSVLDGALRVRGGTPDLPSVLN